MKELAALIQAIAGQEETLATPLTLADVRVALGARGTEDTVRLLLDQDVLLADHRLQWDSATGTTQPVRLCRLNRHHPTVRAALA